MVLLADIPKGAACHVQGACAGIQGQTLPASVSAGLGTRVTVTSIHHVHLAHRCGKCRSWPETLPSWVPESVSDKVASEEQPGPLPAGGLGPWALQGCLWWTGSSGSWVREREREHTLTCTRAASEDQTQVWRAAVHELVPPSCWVPAAGALLTWLHAYLQGWRA